MKHSEARAGHKAQHLTNPPTNLSDDLALNKPGASLRKKAGEVRRSQPFHVGIMQAFGVRSRGQTWRRGAKGEGIVARRLRTLGDEWHVLHSVPIGTGETDIDHVVIGPPGVFTLNTKNHSGKRITACENMVYVNGWPQPYIERSRSEGIRATRLLSANCDLPVSVKPMVVTISNQLNVRGQSTDVTVVAMKHVAKWLASQPSQLSPMEVELIFGAARRRSTWVNVVRMAH